MAKYGVKEVMDVTLYDVSTGAPVLYLDTLKMINLEQAAETVYARGGKGNAKLIGWDGNKEITLAVQDALIDIKSLELMAGAKTELPVDGVELHIRERVLVGAEGDVTLKDGTPAGKIHYVDASGEFVEATGFTGATGTIAELAGETVDFFYTIKKADAVELYEITANDFPGTYKFVGDTLIRNAATGSDEKFQMVIDRVKLLPGFTLQFQAEGDPSPFDMNMEALRPIDGSTMVKLIKY